MAKHNWSPWAAAAAAKGKQSLTDEAVGLPGSRLPVRRGQYAWNPNIDMYETASGLTIKVDLPGLAREDVSLHVEAHGLILAGERRPVKEQGEEQEEGVFHMLERPCGQFSRRIDLPEGLDLEGTRAVLREGVLTISVPRSPSSGSRRISVDE